MSDKTGVSPRRVFPAASPGLLQLLDSAAEAGLEAVDFYTIKDLQELSGYPNEELAVLLACLFLALRQGSVCIDLAPDALCERLGEIVDKEHAPQWEKKISASLDTESFPELIGNSDADCKPAIVQKCGTRRLLYFQKYLKHEQALKTLLSQRLGVSAPAVDFKKWQPIFNEAVAQRGNVRLCGEQKLAIALSLLRNFVVISGGPGTGKTSIVVALLHCLMRGGIASDRMLLACPTGRAAQRLTESLRAWPQNDGEGFAAPVAHTLHRLLGYNPKSGLFNHHRENRLQADVLIVDEVSMMDVVLMSRFLEAASPRAKIVLLGDKDQLPSVDAGSVLSDLTPNDGQMAFSTDVCSQLKALTGIESIKSSERAGDVLCDAVVILKENFRSQKHISSVARTINELKSADAHASAALIRELPRLKLSADEGNTGCLKWPACSQLKLLAGQTEQGGCYLLDHPHRADEWRRILDAWARHHYLDAAPGRPPFPQMIDEVKFRDAHFDSGQDAKIEKVLAVVNAARVLTLIREGFWGCEGVNAHLSRLLGSGRGGAERGGLFSGAPVLITANDHQQQLFNGDVGVALRSHDGGLRVVFQRQDSNGRRFSAFAPDLLPSHELAFAMTVHKSQGSEYDQVLLVLPQEGGQRLQNRQLVYTAITRAKKLAVCYGSESALAAAIGRTLKRCSGLKGLIAES